jgi:signal transduction histidine kinase
VPYRQEHRLRRPDGDYRWFLVQAEPVRDEDGVVVQWLGAATDIQEQRTAMEVLEARVAEATVELRNLSRRLLSIQEEERRHLARELHDEVGQALTGLSLTLATARRGGEQQHLDDAVAISDDLLERVRQLSLDLRPSILDDLGLLPALLSHFERYTLRTGVQVDMRHRGLEQRYPPDVETTAYRVIQEALTNIARHAETDYATVRVIVDEWLTVHVGDQGCGFDVDDRRITGRSSGLTGMRERVTLLGGRISIESTPNEGTTVVAELPLELVNNERASETGP